MKKRLSLPHRFFCNLEILYFKGGKQRYNNIVVILYPLHSHVNRKTQFENPVHARRRQSQSSSVSYSTAPPPHEGPPSFQSAAALAKAQEAEAHSRSVHPSQPNISMHILYTVLYIHFPRCRQREFVYQSQLLQLVIISCILMTFMCDFAVML